MSVALVHLFTLAEAYAEQQNRSLSPRLRTALAHAVQTVVGSGMNCIACSKPLGGAVAYVSLLMANDGAFVPQYGGVCVACGTTIGRDRLARRVGHDAHLNFGEVAGSA